MESSEAARSFEAALETQAKHVAEFLQLDADGASTPAGALKLIQRRVPTEAEKKERADIRAYERLLAREPVSSLAPQKQGLGWRK